MAEIDPAVRDSFERSYVRWFAVFLSGLSLIPFLYALAVAPAGSHYLGFQYNLDDHMVYAAWMRQAMDGHFFFDNRFAVDAQPGLTVNVYFFVLGLLAKVLTIPYATAVARAGLTYWFVHLAAGLIRRLSQNVYTTKLALTLTGLGAGVGYLVWHDFGQLIVKPSAQIFSGIMLGRLPTDVWQPEGYVLSSALTNSLFMMSLCLILIVFKSILDARDTWKPVGVGFIAMAALMNIHSYDALLIAFVMLAFLAASLARKKATWQWVLRAGVIAAGAVLPAVWFLHVLAVDPVFQARAATPTYAPNFRQVFFGYFPMIVLAAAALVKWKSSGLSRRRLAGTVVLYGLLFAAFVAATNQPPDGYWMSLSVWCGLMALVIGAVCLLAQDDPTWNLIVAWAAVGMFAPYFPQLFERKLAMGLAVPWAILAGLGLGALISHRDRGSRNMVTILGILAVCGSSLLWVVRETHFARTNVSNTVLHPVYLSSEEQRILNYLQDYGSKRTVVLAMPGVPTPIRDESGTEVPDSFDTPYMPDLNPILSGFAGVYTYAGHWSETPDYGRRRDEAMRFFLDSTSPAYRAQVLQDVQPDFIVAPVPEAFHGIADVRSLGEVVVSGSQFNLIHVTGR